MQPRPSHALARAERLDGDGLLDAGERFLEAELEIVAQVGAARRVLPRAARSMNSPKMVEKMSEKPLKPASRERVAAAAVLEGGMAEAVIGGALLRVLETS